MLLASASTDWIKDALGILGGLSAVLGMAFGVWLALRKRAERRQANQLQNDETYRSRISTLELHRSSDEKFARGLQAQINAIAEDVDKLRGRCVQHQQGQHLASLQEETRRLLGKVDKIAEDLNKYKESVADKFLPQKVHYADLDMLQNVIDALRQTVNDISTTLTKILTRS
jgi:chromosome segregation ATPase